jgi:hypothetical protein
MYFACFHVHLRYGLTLWCGDPVSIKIFWLQKKVIRIVGKVGRHVSCRNLFKDLNSGELSYLAPLGSEKISAPYFKQCFFRGGEYNPPGWVKHHASQSQDRNNKYFILYIEFCINNKI